MVESVTPPCRLMPSAKVSRMRTPLNVRLVIGPSIQMPTFMCSIQMFEIVELLIAPPMPLYLVAVVAGLDVAEDGEVGQVHVGAPVLPATPQLRFAEAVEAGRGAGDRRVPHAGASSVTLLTVMWQGML